MDLGNTNLTAEGFADLSPLPSLKVIHLGVFKDNVSDAGVKAMVKAFPNLEGLDLHGQRLTVDAILAVGSAESLKRLWLRDARQLDESWMPHLASLKGLVALDLSTSRLSDGHLAALEPLKRSLTELSVGKTHLTDASIDILQRFAELRPLDVTGTEIGSQGADRLRMALPACEVRFQASPEKALPDLKIVR